MIFIDANVFLAYDNADDIHHEKALKIWNAIENNSYGPYFTSDYIFNEVIGVTLRKRGKEQALALGNHILKTTLLLHIDEHLLQQAWKIFTQTKLQLSLVDCTNLVALKLADTNHLATFDKEFNSLPEIKIISS